MPDPARERGDPQAPALETRRTRAGHHRVAEVAAQGRKSLGGIATVHGARTQDHTVGIAGDAGGKGQSMNVTLFLGIVGIVLLLYVMRRRRRVRSDD
jgi:LPXTG-motif cell wall-anchored protein